MADTVEQLAQRFNIPGVLRVERGAGGLASLEITSQLAGAQIYLHGAHVTHWQPAGQRSVLFLSGKSLFAPGKAIRGGVPICFPWFGGKAGDAVAPAHGFARTMEWELESTAQRAGGEVEIVLTLKTDESTQRLWAADAVIRNRIVVGRTLEMALEVANRGNAAITFEEAQHSYFVVGDVRQVRVNGLDGVTYIDKVDGLKRKVQEGPVVFTAETDRVYLNTQSECVVDDPSMKRTIKIEKENSNATVVWNPWINKAKAMADFGDDEWPGMVCVETCNVGEYAVKLAAGQTYKMTTRISVMEMDEIGFG